jgi:hypothetical protein
MACARTRSGSTRRECSPCTHTCLQRSHTHGDSRAHATR